MEVRYIRLKRHVVIQELNNPIANRYEDGALVHYTDKSTMNDDITLAYCITVIDFHYFVLYTMILSID